jgi:hypothetical protein
LLEFIHGGSTPATRQEGAWKFFILIAPVWMCTRIQWWPAYDIW